MMETPGNPFKHVGDAFKHAGQAIKHGAEDAGKTLSDTGSDIGKGDFDKAGSDIKHDSEAGAAHAAHSADLIGNDLEAALMTSINDITHLGDTIKKDINNLAGGIKNDLQNFINAAESKATQTLEQAAKGAEGDAKKVFDDALKGVREEAVKARDAVQGIGDDIKKDLEQFAEESKQALQYDLDKLEEVLSSSILKEGLQKADKLIKELVHIVEEVRANAPEIVDDLNSIEGTIEIGPILCNYSGIVDRLEDLAVTLDNYLTGKTLELSRSLIKTLITDLGPDSIRLDLDEEMISRFGFLAKEVPLSIFTWAADELLEKLGVPE